MAERETKCCSWVVALVCSKKEYLRQHFPFGTLLPTQVLCDAIIQIRRVKIVSSLALYEYREALDLHKRGRTESSTTFAFWVSRSARDACNVLTRGIAMPVVVHENHERAGTGLHTNTS